MRHAPRPARPARPAPVATSTVYAHYETPAFPPGRGSPGPRLTVSAPCAYVPLWWQVRGLSYTASGYGRRIPTTRMIQLPGSPVWRRVYCCIYSNSGTCYVDGPRDPLTGKRGPWITISD